MARVKAPHVRIIGGLWRGRHVHFPEQDGLRPSPDRARETLFNWLGPHLSGARCLDLFAGSGVLGFEALSRGAARVTLVDNNPAVARALQETQRLLGATSAEVVAADGGLFLKTLDPQSFDIIFLDPPFKDRLMPATLTLIRERGILARAGLLYLEAAAGSSSEPPAGFRWHRLARAGKVAFGLACLQEDVP